MRIQRWFVGKTLRPSSGLEVFWRQKTWLLGDTFEPASRDPLPPCAYEATRPDVAISDFGAHDRLAWPTGACAIPHDTLVAHWSARFTAWSGPGLLAIVDTTTNVVVELRSDALFPVTERLYVYRDRLVVSGVHDVKAVSLAEVEALFAHRPGPIVVDVVTTFPLHQPNRRVKGTVDWSSATMLSISSVDGDHLYLDPQPFVGERELVEMSNELWRDHFLVWRLEDGEVRELAPPPTPPTFTLELAIGPAIDPAGTAFTAVAAPERQTAVDDLLSQFADEPDPTTASILIDLLQESGAAYAELLARLLAGDTSVQVEALGPLWHFLTDLELTHGLPTRASLAEDAPQADEFVAAISADQRLGLLHTFRLGGGAPKLYAKLVGAPRAIGLRHVDLPNPTVLAALVAGKRTQLTHLSNVKFTTKDVIHGVADPTFDRVTTIHVETAPNMLAAQLATFTRDEARFWARAPRHLVLTDRNGRDDTLHAAIHAAWGKLPVRAVTAGSLTLSR